MWAHTISLADHERLGTLRGNVEEPSTVTFVSGALPSQSPLHPRSPGVRPWSPFTHGSRPDNTTHVPVTSA